MCGGLLFAKKPGIRCTTTMWPTVMQLAFCGQLVFRTSVNTKRLRADYYKEITLRQGRREGGFRGVQEPPL